MPIIVVEVPGVGEYKGEVNEKGEFHGRGAMTFTAGGSYDGDWQHNKREGMGTFSYSDGSAYTGMYKNGKKEGFGDQTYAEGDRYQGDWSSGFRNGWGKMQYSQSDTQYEGQWKDDRKNGMGILTHVAKINTWSLEVWENDILLCSRKFDKTDSIFSHLMWRDIGLGNVQKFRDAIETGEWTHVDAFSLCGYERPNSPPFLKLHPVRSSTSFPYLPLAGATIPVPQVSIPAASVPLPLPVPIPQTYSSQTPIPISSPGRSTSPSRTTPTSVSPPGRNISPRILSFFSSSPPREKPNKSTTTNTTTASVTAALADTLAIDKRKSEIENGFGIMEYPDGKKYQGMFESGKREGFGVLTSDSETFEGNWKEDQRNGWGFWLDSDSNRHEGTWLNDTRDGAILVTTPGSSTWRLQIWANGAIKFERNMSTNDPLVQEDPLWDVRRNISPVLKSKLENPAFVKSLLESFEATSDGTIVKKFERTQLVATIPNILHDAKDPKHMLARASTILNPLEHIQLVTGTLTFPFGVYIGELTKDGKLCGRGQMKFRDGSRYEGEWKDDQRNGEGVFIYNDGSKYTGHYLNNKKSGYGVQNYVNGDIFQGDWKNGARDGWGMFRQASGHKYEGQWKDDRKDGVGIGSHVSSSTRSIEVWNKSLLKAYREYAPAEFAKLEPALQKMFEKADSSPLRNSIENGSFQKDNYVIPLSNQVWDKKTTIAVKSGFLNKNGPESPKIVFPIEKYSTKVTIEKGKFTFVFTPLSSSDSKAHAFQAATPVERDDWIWAIAKVSTHFKNTPDLEEPKPDASFKSSSSLNLKNYKNTLQ